MMHLFIFFHHFKESLEEFKQRYDLSVRLHTSYNLGNKALIVDSIFKFIIFITLWCTLFKLNIVAAFIFPSKEVSM